MLTALLVLLVSIPVLAWSADRFVFGAKATASHFGLSPLLIGMVIVGFGTSAPEMLVSGLAAWDGHLGLALGNAYGSNTANLALVLGSTALLSPVILHSRVVRREIPLLLAATVLTLLLLFDRELARFDAGLLLLFFSFYLIWAIRTQATSSVDALARETADELPADKLGRSLGWLLLGLTLLLLSAKALVWAAEVLARGIGISDLVIGLTVLAIGTSLPELASSLAAARRREHDIALGNVIGSNLFNTLIVVGIAGAIAPGPIDPQLASRDLPVMSAFTFGLLLLALRARDARISRANGLLLLAGFFVYNTLLLLSV